MSRTRRKTASRFWAAASRSTALPSDVTSVADLAGRELPFEFSGDGDDFNLCFVGSQGLLGVERGTVRVTKVDGSTVPFSFAGDFVRDDGEGGESPGTIAPPAAARHASPRTDAAAAGARSVYSDRRNANSAARSASLSVLKRSRDIRPCPP